MGSPSSAFKNLGNRPLAYCIFSALYAPSTGGVEAYTAGLAKELVAQGHRVLVVTSQLDPSHPAHEVQDDGVEVMRLPSRTLLGGRLPLPRRNAEYRRLWNTLVQARPRRIVINTRFYPHSLEAARFARSTNTPAVIIEHGSAHLSLGNPLLDKAVEAYEHGITRRICAYRLPYAGVSSRTLAWLQHFGIAGEAVVPNALDLQAYAAAASARDFRRELGLSENTFLVASVGRLVPEKGIPALLEAMRLLEEPIALAVAGTGPLHAHVLQATGNVHALGRLDAPDIAALLRTADALCLPSRSEGFATVLLEAAALGTAPVVTPVGGTDELGISHGNGIILESTAPEAIANALRSAAQQREHTQQIGMRLHAYACEHNTWSQSVAALESLFDRITAEGSR